MSKLIRLKSKIIRESVDPVLMPTNVVSAMKQDFPVAITGYLTCAATEAVCLIGIVFGDTSGRFVNGHSIRTSFVLERQLIHGYVIVKTLNSRYVICDWAPAEHGPLFTGVRH